MSTEGMITIFNGKYPIVSIISHYDGYLDGVGTDLAKFLEGCELVNGIPGGATPKGERVRYSNGMDCLAAQVVTHFKGDENSAGGIYLTAPVTIEELSEEDYPIPFVYEVRAKVGGLEIRAYESTYDMTSSYKKVFVGTPNEFLHGKKKAAPKKKVAAKKRK